MLQTDLDVLWYEPPAAMLHSLPRPAAFAAEGTFPEINAGVIAIKGAWRDKALVVLLWSYVSQLASGCSDLPKYLEDLTAAAARDCALDREQTARFDAAVWAHHGKVANEQELLQDMLRRALQNTTGYGRVSRRMTPPVCDDYTRKGRKRADLVLGSATPAVSLRAVNPREEREGNSSLSRGRGRYFWHITVKHRFREESHHDRDRFNLSLPGEQQLVPDVFMQSEDKKKKANERRIGLLMADLRRRHFSTGSGGAQASRIADTASPSAAAGRRWRRSQEQNAGSDESMANVTGVQRRATAIRSLVAADDERRADSLDDWLASQWSGSWLASLTTREDEHEGSLDVDLDERE